MKKISRRILALSMAAVLLASGAVGIVKPGVAHAASTFTVDSTLDTGDSNPGDNICDDGTGVCTLRAAIEEANANANPTEQDTISFGLTGTADFTNGGQDGYTFAPASSYPSIAEPLIIDGYSQIGSQPNTSNPSAGLNSVLLIQVTGSPTLPSMFRINSDDVTIKGLVLNGVSTVQSSPVGMQSGTNTQILGNYFGTDPTGLIARPNYGGLVLQAGSGTRVGSPSFADANLFSANSGAGIVIVNHTGARIQGNLIGPDVNGSTSSGISASSIGVAIIAQTASDNTVGGTSVGDENVIAGNNQGIAAYATDYGTPERNSFLGNSIYDNQIGIDLAADTNSDFIPETNLGPNANDPGDTDNGANDYLNTPVIHSAVYDQSIDRLYVHLDLDVAGSPSDSYRVEFFANDTNTSGEGKTLLYSQDNVSARLNQGLSFQPGFDPTGKYITATVTQHDDSFSNQGYGATSEFSAPVAATAGELDLDITKTLTNPNDIHVGGTADYDLRITNNGQAPVPLAVDDNNGFSVYDLAPPQLTFASASGDALVGCQQAPDQDAQGFLSSAASHHLNYGVVFCAPGREQPLMPGESTTFHVHFTVNSIPAEGFANYTVLFNVHDPDFITIINLSDNGNNPLDMIDLLADGTLQGNGNVAVAKYTPSAGQSSGRLASSGMPIELYGLLAAIFVSLPGGVLITRQRRRIWRTTTRS